MGPVAVYGSASKKGVVDAVDSILPRLRRDFGVTLVDLDGSADPRADDDAEWAILFGGDGAVLSLSRRMGDRPIPTLAVNFGKLGFLTEVEAGQVDDALGRVKEGRVKLRERMRLEACIGDWSCLALNDVVVSGRQSGRVFHVSARIGGHEALRYAGDGVVIATPTGSTAYSMAAGGPILDPEIAATVITPLCAHALSHRPLVVSNRDSIELYLRPSDPAGRVVLDGQISRELGLEERVFVRDAKSPFVLIRLGVRSHYARLRRMLGWGSRPKP